MYGRALEGVSADCLGDGGGAFGSASKSRRVRYAQHGIRAGGATAIAEIGMILGVAALLALTGQQLVRGFISLTSNVIQGYQQLVDWLKSMGYELGADQLNQVLDQVEQVVSNNPSTCLEGCIRGWLYRCGACYRRAYYSFYPRLLLDGGRTHLAVYREALPETVT